MSKRRILEDSDSDDDDDVVVVTNPAPSNSNTNRKSNSIASLLNLTPEEQTKLDNCSITNNGGNNAANGGRYSADAMSRALETILPLLTERNNNNANQDYQHYQIKEATRKEYYERPLYHPNNNSSTLSEEQVLLEIEMANQSSKKVKVMLFKSKGVQTMFGPWWNYALGRVYELSNSTTTELKFEEYTATKILLALFAFIRHHSSDLVAVGKLADVKKKFSVDWIDCTEKARRVIGRCGGDVSGLNGGTSEFQLLLRREFDGVNGYVERLKGGSSGVGGSVIGRNNLSSSCTAAAANAPSKQKREDVGRNAANPMDGERRSHDHGTVATTTTTTNTNIRTPRNKKPMHDDGWGRKRDGSASAPFKTNGPWPARQTLSSIGTTLPNDRHQPQQQPHHHHQPHHQSHHQRQHAPMHWN